MILNRFFMHSKYKIRAIFKFNFEEVNYRKCKVDLIVKIWVCLKKYIYHSYFIKNLRITAFIVICHLWRLIKPERNVIEPNRVYFKIG